MTTNKSIYTKWAVIVALVVICLLVPEQGLYTHQVKLFLAITVFGLGLAAFELAPIILISIVMPALWIITGVAPVSTVMGSWVGTTVLLLIGAFLLAATLEDCGLLKRLSFYLMCKVKGSYFVLLLSMFFIGVLLNIAASGNGNIILAPLALGLCMSLNAVGKKFGAGMAAAVMLGTCQSHVYTFYPTAWGILYQLGTGYFTAADITPVTLFLHCWPMMVVSIITVWVTSKIFKPDEDIDLTNITYFKEGLAQMGPVTKREKTNAVVLIILLVYVFTAGIHKMDVNLGFAIIPWLVFLPGLDGANEETIKKINFPIIFFVVACMSIGTVASGLGLGQALADFVKVTLGGLSGNPFAIFGFVFLITFVMNFAMTPIAILSLLVAPMCIYATELGISPIPFVYALNCSIEAILLPYEYVPYLVTFGFGMITMKDFIKFSAVRSGLFFVGMLGLLIPYWILIGLI